MWICIALVVGACIGFVICGLIVKGKEPNIELMAEIKRLREKDK